MLDAFFFDTACRTPTAPALWVNEQTYDYQTLSELATKVRDILLATGETTPCLLFAHRSVQAYAGLLGIMASGSAYVPLGAHFPTERNVAIARRSGARTILVDSRCKTRLAELLAHLGDSYRILDLDTLMAVLPNASANTAPDVLPQDRRTPEDIAYILFTSGTTGVPKGVKVTHANATAYMRSQCALDAPLDDARYSQAFDLTFDLSVHDMFVCWANGACLYVPPDNDALTLATFVRTHALTHWGSVPSTASFLQQFRKLKENSFPTLRISMFCGEALPTMLARAWQRAAPNSRILNLYGPTEATISCLRFETDAGLLAASQSAVVPLGWSLPGQQTLVVDAENKPVPDGDKGELLLGGVQVAAGYISDNPKDHAKFFEHRFEGRTSLRWYRTGDMASVCPIFGMRFHGRVDTQLKIRGNRIEAQEIEHAVQQASDAAMVAVIPWPMDEAGMPLGLVAFVSGTATPEAIILDACRRALPSYAVPDKVVQHTQFPVNVNGKTDKNALFQWCQENANLATLSGSAA